MKINFCLISLFFIVPFLTQSQDAKDIVDRIIEDGLKAAKSKKGLADPNYV